MVGHVGPPRIGTGRKRAITPDHTCSKTMTAGTRGNGRRLAGVPRPPAAPASATVYVLGFLRDKIRMRQGRTLAGQRIPGNLCDISLLLSKWDAEAISITYNSHAMSARCSPETRRESSKTDNTFQSEIWNPGPIHAYLPPRVIIFPKTIIGTLSITLNFQQEHGKPRLSL